MLCCTFYFLHHILRSLCNAPPGKEDENHHLPPALQIASVASLELTVQEVVELGGTLEAEVVALDASGTPLPAHSLMDLQPHPQSSVISARCVEGLKY